MKSRNQNEISTPKSEVGKTELTIKHPHPENTPQAERAAISQQAATQLPENMKRT